MAKLFVFGIGGTGSRVIKALTMLLASGVRLENNFDSIIPIIIDPDKANGDLNRTKDILTKYQQIRQDIHQPDDFFYTKIQSIRRQQEDSEVINPSLFQFQLNNVDDTTFGQYLGYASMAQDFQNNLDDKRFLKLLFSQHNLESDLSVGFKGNPNMGSVVLSQFTNSEDFNAFAQTFSPGDSIFIINSIFGGTGAAGFPLLLKTLRSGNVVNGGNLLSQSKIGGVTFLPYFQLDRQDEVSSNSFGDKAKVAMDYYNRTIINTNQINSIYFLGNKNNVVTEGYAVGGQEQKNNANFLEMAGALAIIDYCKNFGNLNGNTQVKEFGIENRTDIIKFSDLSNDDYSSISVPLKKFKLFVEYLEKGLPKALGTSRWTKSNIKLSGEHRNSMLNENYFKCIDFSNEIVKFNKYFNEWLKEMSNANPSFQPFNHVERSNILEFVNGVKPVKEPSCKAIDINNCLLTDDNSIRNKEKKHTMLIKMFGRTTEKVLSDNKLL